jgi:hypothetical protein
MTELGLVERMAEAWAARDAARKAELGRRIAEEDRLRSQRRAKNKAAEERRAARRQR